jgi:hypothetical protein
VVPAFVASSRNGEWLLPLLNTALVGVLDLGKTNVKSTSQYSCSVAQCSACGFPLLDNEYGHGPGAVTFAAAEAGQCVLYRSQTAPVGVKVRRRPHGRQGVRERNTKTSPLSESTGVRHGPGWERDVTLQCV